MLSFNVLLADYKYIIRSADSGMNDACMNRLLAYPLYNTT